MKPSPSSSSCISKILRRILCFSTTFSSSTRTFTEIKEEKETSSLIGGASSNPGIVARLMGLNTLPLRIEPIDGSPSMSSSGSVKKPRSPQLRRRTIVNLSYKELEDENFFILSFEHESNVERRKLCKKKKSKKSIRRRENLQENDNENEGVVNIVYSKGNMDIHVENQSTALRPLTNSCGDSEIRRKKKGNGDCSFAAINSETEVHSENSSPNSVLEFVEFLNHQEDSVCSGDISRLSNLKMRRTLSEELDNCRNCNEKKSINSGFGEQEKLRNKGQKYAEKWDEIGRLAAKEIIKLSWVQNKISRDEHIVGEIGSDLASEILDQLLDELLPNIPKKII